MLPKKNYLKLNLKNKSTEISEYENNTENKYITDIDEAECLVSQYLESSVKRHMISDAPIGVFLSGGLDSSIIASIASKTSDQKINTLSVNFDEQSHSENYYQDIVVSSINSQHHNININQDDFINNIDNIFQCMDQPTTDGVNSYFISKYANEIGLKAVLSGTGADELFGGYPSFRRINNIAPLLKIQKISPGIFSLFEYLKYMKYKRFSFLKINNPLSVYLLLRGRFSIKTIANILDTSSSYVEETLETVCLKKEFNPDLNFISNIEKNIYMQNQLLKDADFMSMSNSLEVRVPYLDKDFLKIVGNIDKSIRYNSKSILRNCYKNLLDPQIINRKKMGFTFPFKKWFMNKLDFFIDYGELGKTKYEKNIISDFKSGNLNWSGLWSLIVLNNHSSV